MSERPSILVVDDDPVNFEVIEALLGAENYTLHYADSGQTALDRLDELKPDAILLDLMMPAPDGIDVCLQIRALPQWASLPIVMVSALPDRKNMERCFAAGATGYVTKPVSRKTLVEGINAALEIDR